VSVIKRIFMMMMNDGWGDLKRGDVREGANAEGACLRDPRPEQIQVLLGR